MTEYSRWEDVKAKKEAIDRAKDRDVEAARAEARRRRDAYIGGYRLSQLRVEAGMTQTALAERMGISQARVSKLERGDPSQFGVDTVSRYVAAVGGRLRLVADFEDHDVIISTTQVNPAAQVDQGEPSERPRVLS